MNILEGYSNTQIDERVGRIAKSERKITHLVLAHIVEVERRKLYLDFGYTSVYQYLVQRHGYCESSAYLRTSAAKLFAQNPQLEAMIEDGKIKLSQIAKVQKFVRQKNKMTPSESDRPVSVPEVLSLLANKSAFETEKILCREFDQKPIDHQQILPQQDGSVRVSFTLSAEEFELLENVRNQKSHVIPTREIGELFVHLLKSEEKVVRGASAKHKNPKFVATAVADGNGKEAPPEDRSDETKKKTQSFAASSAASSDGTNDGLNDGTNDAPSSTRSFAAEEISGKLRRRGHLRLTIRRRLLSRCGHQCEFIHEASGVRCESRYQLQLDHIVPLALGGDDSKSNLRILCGVHNRAEAFRLNLWKASEAELLTAL